MNNSQEKVVMNNGINKFDNEGLVIGGTKVMFTKVCDRYNAAAEEELTYTLVLNNNSPDEITKVIFMDTIPENTTLVEGSVSVNNNTLPDNNPISVSIDSVLTGEIITLTYKVKIDNNICKTQSIVNTANLFYKNTDNQNMELISNKVFTNIKNATLKVERFSDKRKVNIGDKLIYVVSIENIGNEKVNQVILTEEIPMEVCCSNNFIKINDTCIYDSELSSVNLGSIKSGEKRVIIYEVEVISMPVDGEFFSASKVNYKFTTDQLIPNGVSREIESNTVITEVCGFKGSCYCKIFN